MNWYYAHEGQQQGPVSEEQLANLVRLGVIGSSNLVWRDGLADWGPLGTHAPHLLPPPPPANPPAVPVPVAEYAAIPAPLLSGYVPPQSYPFQFHGRTGEFFRIWIVNTALTILTLGIYAAWAKVRTRRYFYGHTTLDGASFDYHANPISVLKGNLIMGAMALLYFGSGAVFPAITVVILLIFFLFAPWLIHKAFRFRAWNTSYRNLRFRFLGDTGEAYVAYCWLALLTPFTLGLIIPYQVWRTKRYFYNNLSFGTSRFQFRAEAGSFYSIYLKVIAFVILLFVGLAFIVPTIVVMLSQVGSSSILVAQSEAPPLPGKLLDIGALIGMMIGAVIYLAFIIGITQYLAVRITNLCLNSTSVGGETTRFLSQIRLRDMIVLQVTNLLAIVFSLGLAIPWVQIRMARYRASKTFVVAPAGGLENFTAGAVEKDSALGDAAADVFDMDIGF